MNLDNTDDISSTSFIELFSKIWNSLDDILVCLGVFLVVQVFSSRLNHCLLNYFDMSAYIAQSAQFLFLFSTIIFLISHLLGSSVAVSLFSGFSIGLGYALQPYIVSLLAGGTLRMSNIIRRGDTLIIEEKSLVVDHVGLLYISTKKDKVITYFPSAMLSSRPFSIQRFS